MLQTTTNQFSDASINGTNISYSRAQIVGNPADIIQGNSMKIVIKSSNVKMLDIANSCINFVLQITPGGTDGAGVSTTGPLVLMNSAADIFSVTGQHTLNGTSLNMLQRLDTHIHRRNVMKHINGHGNKLSQGLIQDFDDYQPSNGYAVTVAGPALEIAKNVILPDNRAYSRNLDGLIQTQIQEIPLTHYQVAYQERCRLITEVKKHYKLSGAQIPDPDTAAAAGALPTVTCRTNDDKLTRTYSVKLKDIVPELEYFTCVDPKMLQGAGLELNFVLASPDLCMMRPPVGISAQTTGWYRHDADTYKITDPFLSLVYLDSVSPGLGMFNIMPLKSIYHTVGSLSDSSMQHQFSLNSKCFVKGAFITMNPNGQQLGHGNDAGGRSIIKMGGATGLGSVNTERLSAYKAQCQFYKTTSFLFTIGADNYAKQQAPPVSSPANFSYIVAQQMSEQIFGLSYGNSLQSYLSKDFVVFVPVNRYVNQGELFQVNIQYEGLDDAVWKNAELNIFVLCDRLLGLNNDGSTTILK